MKNTIHRDVYVGAACLIFCAAVLGLALEIKPGANYLPLALSVFMGAMSILMIITGIREGGAAGETGSSEMNLKSSKRPILVYLMIAAYLVLFQTLGYFVATILFLVALQWYLKAGSWKRISFVTLGYLIFTYVLFVKILALPIYRVGIFGRLFRF